MKKIICFILVLAMAMSLVACGSAEKAPEASVESPATQTTETSVVEPTTPEEDETAVLAEQLLVANAETVIFDTLAEYEEKLHELGFAEFRADIWRATPDSAPALYPVELTFNDEVFRLTFNYNQYDYNSETEYLEENWILYGMKSDGAYNISDYRDENYENYDIFDNNSIPELASDFVHQIDYSMYNLKDAAPEYLVMCSAYYYPNTSNLYNLVHKYDDAMGNIGAQPYVLAKTEEEVTMEVFWELNDMDASSSPVPMFIMWGPNNMEYSYEPWMTLSDWVLSSYNVDGWTVHDDNTCRTPDGLYFVSPADVAIGSLETIDYVIQCNPMQ